MSDTSFKVVLGDVFVSTGGDYGLHPGVMAVAKAKRVPVKTQYHLSKILKRLTAELRDFMEHRLELFKEYGHQVMDGDKPIDRWTVDADRIDEFLKAFAELSATEVTIELRPIKLAELEAAEGTTSEDLAACHAFIEED